MFLQLFNYNSEVDTRPNWFTEGQPKWAIQSGPSMDSFHQPKQTACSCKPLCASWRIREGVIFELLKTNQWCCRRKRKKKEVPFGVEEGCKQQGACCTCSGGDDYGEQEKFSKICYSFICRSESQLSCKKRQGIR